MLSWSVAAAGLPASAAKSAAARARVPASAERMCSSLETREAQNRMIRGAASAGLGSAGAQEARERSGERRQRWTCQHEAEIPAQGAARPKAAAAHDGTAHDAP